MSQSDWEWPPHQPGLHGRLSVFQAPVRFPEQFKVLGLGAPSGVLLTGPPGCGKTLLAKVHITPLHC